MPALTREEFEALPEIGFGREERVIAGRKVLVPVMPHLRLVWFEEDEPHGYIIDGVLWKLVETADGTRGRLRCSR